MSTPRPSLRRRSRLPLSGLACFAGAGLLGTWALVFLGLWLQTVGAQQGWWNLPADDEPDTALVLGCVLLVPAALLVWGGARRCRRSFGYSRLSTGLVATATAVVAGALALGVGL